MLSLFNKCAILSESVAAVFQLKPSWVAAEVRVSVGPLESFIFSYSPQKCCLLGFIHLLRDFFFSKPSEENFQDFLLFDQLEK